MRSKWKWRIGVAGVVAAVAVIFHAAILRGLATPLIVDESADPCQWAAIFDFNGLPDGDRCFDAAAEMVRRHSCGVLSMESASTRLVECGALTPFATLSRRELHVRGVSPGGISVMRRDGEDDWSTARAIQTWTADHPGEIIELLCDRFRSAHVRYALDSTLEPDRAACVRVRALADRRYDETNWWKCRKGIRQFGIEWLRQLHGWCVGGDFLPPPSENADDYERRFLIDSSPSASHWLDAGRPPHAADYIMILAGGENTRPFVSAALYKSGMAHQVLITQTADLPQNVDQILPPMYEINRKALIERGVPPNKIVILPAAADATYDEAKALAAFLQDKPEARVLVVTDDFHTRRSRWVFDRALGGQSGQVSFVSAPYIDFARNRWWQDENHFIAVSTEYPKLIFYVVDYGYFGYWLLACGVLTLVAVWIRNQAASRK